MIYLFMNNGGLGNQMYQYAFARKLQKLYGDPICCDVSKFAYKDSSATKRPFALDNFMLTDNLTVGAYTFRRLMCKTKQKLYKSEKDYDKLARKGLFIPTSYMDYYPAQNCLSKNKYVKGLFQSHRCFDDIKDILRTEFVLKEKASVLVRELQDEIEEVNSVCVHWRRGDYLEAQYAHLNICDLDYYKRAMDAALKELQNPIFYIFTNSSADANYIKDNYNFPYSVKYINLELKDTYHSDIDDFCLMKSCRHFIISNSTFSWWAQYLNDNSKKLVYAPSIWMRSDIDTSELYQTDWKIIDVEDKIIE